MKTAVILGAALMSVVLSTPAAEMSGALQYKHLFILSGQSNMRRPLPDAFMESVNKVFGKDNVIVVTHAQPSQPIKRWYKGWTPPPGEVDPNPEQNGTLYKALLEKVNRAVGRQRIASATYVWMQGEADAGKGWGAVYEKSFLAILDHLKTDLDLAKINFVVGRINDHWLTANGFKDGDLVRSIQTKLGEDNPNGDWVNTDDLNKGVNPWGIYETEGGHFPTPAYRVLGQRFARKACRLIDPKMELDDSFFDAVFCDEAADIESHRAIGKAVSGKPEWAALVDGEFGSSDPKDGSWVTIPPTNESVELVVDMGEKQEITGVGVDVLLNKEAGVLFPKRVVFSVSDDGTDYRQVHRKGITFFYKKRLRDEALSALKPQSLLVFVDTPGQEARFVKIQVAPEETPVLLDEIVVNPVVKTQGK